jgi:hypothetical protein
MVRRFRPYWPERRFWRAERGAEAASAIFTGAGGGGAGGGGAGMLGLHTIGFLLLFFDDSFEVLDDAPGPEAVPDVTIPVLKSRNGDRESPLQGSHQGWRDQRDVVVRLHCCP